MKAFLFTAIFLLSIVDLSQAQVAPAISKTPTRIHLYVNYIYGFTLFVADREISSLKLGGDFYTVIETDMDTLTLRLRRASTQNILVQLERGRSLYFVITAGKDIPSGVKGRLLNENS